MKIIQEFKDFVSKGNVIDLAVGVIIGGAFGKIVDSVVKDIITPIIGLIGGQPDFSGIVLFAHQMLDKDGKPVLKDGIAQLEGGIMVGNFLNALVSFAIIAAVIFFVFVKPMARLKAIASSPTPAPDPAPAPPAPEIALLTEIRDLLKK